VAVVAGEVETVAPQEQQAPQDSVVQPLPHRHRQQDSAVQRHPHPRQDSVARPQRQPLPHPQHRPVLPSPHLGMSDRVFPEDYRTSHGRTNS
jgi:hypothetical protein